MPCSSWLLRGLLAAAGLALAVFLLLVAPPPPYVLALLAPVHAALAAFAPVHAVVVALFPYVCMGFLIQEFKEARYQYDSINSLLNYNADKLEKMEVRISNEQGRAATQARWRGRGQTIGES